MALEQRQFRFLNCVGSGGFGEVYRVDMRNMGGVSTEVAIKILHRELCPTNQAVQRLRDEAHMLGLLRHPNIVRVFDLVDIDGRLALITEFVDGVDLEQIYDTRDAFPVRALIEVVGRVAGALDAATVTKAPETQEPLNLVHRDVKPANIRVGRHGEVKLLDFGIATAGGVARQAKTRAGDVIGSYRYMAPERLSGRHTDTPAADVYSLGQVLFEGLAGRRLFSGSDLRQQMGLAEDLGMHDHFVRKRLDTLEAGSELRAVLRNMLAHDPRLRPDAGKLAALCEDIAESHSSESLRQWCRRRHWKDTVNRPGELSGRTIVARVGDSEAVDAPTRKNLTLMTFDDSTLDEGPTQVPFDVPTEDSISSMGPPPKADGGGPPPPPPGLGPGVTPLPMRRTDVRNVAAPAAASAGTPVRRSGPGRALIGLSIGFGSFVLALFALALLAAGLYFAGAFSGLRGDAEPDIPLPTPVEAELGNLQVEVEPMDEPEATDEAVVPPEPAPPPTVTRPSPEEAPPTEPVGDAAPSNPTFGEVWSKSSVPIQLRQGDAVAGLGEVPSGTWLVSADFGEGWVAAEGVVADVTDGGRVEVVCSSLKLACFVR